MGNKELGIADPVYDALRIRSGQSIAPDLGSGIPPGGGSGLENKIYLWHSDGSTIDLFDPDATGLGLAIAAAEASDTVWLPSMTITLGAPLTIPADITVTGIARLTSVIAGDVTNNGTLTHLTITGHVTNNALMDGAIVQVSSGVGVTQSAGVLSDVSVEMSGTTTYGVDFSGGYLYNTHVSYSAGTPTALKVNAPSSAGEINRCLFAGLAGCEFITAPGVIISNCQFEGDFSGDGLWYRGAGSGAIANSRFNCSRSTTGFGLNVDATGLTLIDCNWSSIDGLVSITYGTGDRGAYGVEDYHATDIEAAVLTRHLPAPTNSASDAGKYPKLNAAGAAYELSDSAAPGGVGGSVFDPARSFRLATFRASDETLYLLTSQDGLTWTALGTQPVYTPVSNTVRDPSILQYGGKFYVAHTDSAAPTFPFQNIDHFNVISSPDLKAGSTWTLVTSVSMTAITGVNRVWAPEFFVDSDNSVHVFVSCSADAGTTFQIYEVHPTNAGWTTWSSPVQVTTTVANLIDAFVVRRGNVYYLWYKNETTKLIEVYSSASLASGYTALHTGDWAGWGANKYEGACLVQLDANRWRIYFDYYTPVELGIYYSESADDWATWSAPAAITAPYTVMHGTVITPIDAANLAGQIGSVTSITAGTGLTATPNPIVTTGTIALNAALNDLNDVDTTGTGTGDIIYNSGAGWVDYPLGIGAKISAPAGKIRIGGIAGGNYLEIDATTGSVRLIGNATAWDDIRITADVVKPGATAPNWKAFGPSGNLQALMFEAGHHDEATFSMQLPHQWKVGTNIYPHVHWTPVNTTAGNVVWQLEYSWANIDGTFGAPGNMATDATAAGGTAWVHKLTDLKESGNNYISGAGKTMSSMLMCRIHRNSNSGSDTLNQDVALLEVDFHFEIDSFGSDTRDVKDETSALFLETGDYLLLETGDRLLME